MKRIFGLEGAGGAALREPVCTIGVFDGVHRGHVRLLADLRDWARETGGETCVITFGRHPATVLRGVEIPVILDLDHRLLELERRGLDAAVVLDFASIRDLGPREFLEKVLRDRLGCRRLLLGFDSHIGRDRSGDAQNLPGIGREVGVEVRIAGRVLDASGEKLGSSAIRRAILSGDLGGAERMLGRPVTVRGVVVRGAGRGRGLGAATANLDTGAELLPPDGIYLVRVRDRGKSVPGVVNLGRRPTFERDGPRILEVHVPGWEGDLYGRTLEVEFRRFLRPEVRFANADELKAKIAEDLEALRRAVDEGEI